MKQPIAILCASASAADLMRSMGMTVPASLRRGACFVCHCAVDMGQGSVDLIQTGEYVSVCGDCAGKCELGMQMEPTEAQQRDYEQFAREMNVNSN